MLTSCVGLSVPPVFPYVVQRTESDREAPTSSLSPAPASHQCALSTLVTQVSIRFSDMLTSKLLMYFNFDLPDSNQLSDQSAESQVTSVTAALQQSNHDEAHSCSREPVLSTSGHTPLVTLKHWIIGSSANYPQVISILALTCSRIYNGQKTGLWDE